ncbi:hypothetical protein B0J12DRAFT_456581 [Macrophomina phaseolina]|uniref:Uncharacterized protein n=1 Tax=Macrophomina phaseolina TaxID=35725 RepID=A0ABQ8GFW8_9PEZI|nr:hypothetical protein B0J12DRAFT_456581 [Macrophomina phaseolina]
MTSGCFACVPVLGLRCVPIYGDREGGLVPTAAFCCCGAASGRVCARDEARVRKWKAYETRRKRSFGEHMLVQMVGSGGGGGGGDGGWAAPSRADAHERCTLRTAAALPGGGPVVDIRGSQELHARTATSAHARSKRMTHGLQSALRPSLLWTQR